MSFNDLISLISCIGTVSDCILSVIHLMHNREKK